MPIEPELGQASLPVREWRGWDRFDEPASYGVFVYGSLMNPNLINDVLGVPKSLPVKWVPAQLRGYERSWSVCTDNTRTRLVRYYEPGSDIRPAIQVLFLNMERTGDIDGVDGIIIFVDGHHLLPLDKREGNYDRVVVTDDISVAAGLTIPDVIWTYVGKAGHVQRARQAIVQGTARIRREYVDAACEAFAAHDGMLESLQSSLSPPAGPDRQPGSKGRLTTRRICRIGN